MKQPEPTSAATPETPKKRYDKPRLRKLGSVAELTLGGTGGGIEGMSGMVGMN